MTEFNRLERVFNTVFGLKSIDDSTSITTVADWDSVSHITLLLQLEQEFSVPISTDEAVDMTSVPEIRKLLLAKGIPPKSLPNKAND